MDGDGAKRGSEERRDERKERKPVKLDMRRKRKDHMRETNKKRTIVQLQWWIH